MFVLHYQESDYDDHQLEILKVSKNKDKLEALKQQFEQNACKFYQTKPRPETKDYRYQLGTLFIEEVEEI